MIVVTLLLGLVHLSIVLSLLFVIYLEPLECLVLVLSWLNPVIAISHESPTDLDFYYMGTLFALHKVLDHFIIRNVYMPFNIRDPATFLGPLMIAALHRPNELGQAQNRVEELSLEAERRDNIFFFRTVVTNAASGQQMINPIRLNNPLFQQALGSVNAAIHGSNFIDPGVSTLDVFEGFQ